MPMEYPLPGERATFYIPRSDDLACCVANARPRVHRTQPERVAAQWIEAEDEVRIAKAFSKFVCDAAGSLKKCPYDLGEHSGHVF